MKDSSREQQEFRELVRRVNERDARRKTPAPDYGKIIVEALNKTTRRKNR